MQPSKIDAGGEGKQLMALFTYVQLFQITVQVKAMGGLLLSGCSNLIPYFHNLPAYNYYRL